MLLLAAQRLCCLPLITVPIPFFGYYFPLTYTWWECHLECPEIPLTMGEGIWPKLGQLDAALLKFEPRIKWPKKCKKKNGWNACIPVQFPNKTVLSFFPLLHPNPLQKCLHSWSCFSKLLGSSINSPMPLQQISFLLQARRVHFCCLQPKSPLWKCAQKEHRGQNTTRQNLPIALLPLNKHCHPPGIARCCYPSSFNVVTKPIAYARMLL